MLENWLNIEGGPNYFFDGLKNYLNAHQYGNADTIDLWTALEHGQLMVTDVMNSWTRQAGFPVITVEETKTGFMLKQSRFFQAGLLKEGDWAQLFRGTNQSLQSIVDNKQEWHIPISMVTYKVINGKSVRGKPQMIYSVGKKPIELNIQANGSQIVIFNAGHTGVYHVQYSAENWNRLGDLLYQNPEILPPIERTGLLM
jgi:aminopeptidase N